MTLSRMGADEQIRSVASEGGDKANQRRSSFRPRISGRDQRTLYKNGTSRTRAHLFRSDIWSTADFATRRKKAGLMTAIRGYLQKYHLTKIYLCCIGIALLLSLTTDLVGGKA